MLLCSSALFLFFLPIILSFFLALVKSCSHEGVLVSLCWAVPFFFFRETGDYRITANCQLLEITTKNILSISALLWCIVQSTRQHFLKVAISLLCVPMTTFHSQRKLFASINTGALVVVTFYGVSPTPFTPLVCSIGHKADRHITLTLWTCSNICWHIYHFYVVF